MAWLYNEKFDGHLDEIYIEGRPEEQCSAHQEELDGRIGLTVAQLAGIWIIVLIFVVAGFIAKIIRNFYYQQAIQQGSLGHHGQKVVLKDQLGNPWENPNTLPTDEDESKDPGEQPNATSSGDNEEQEVQSSKQLADSIEEQEEQPKIFGGNVGVP